MQKVTFCIIESRFPQPKRLSFTDIKTVVSLEFGNLENGNRRENAFKDHCAIHTIEVHCMKPRLIRFFIQYTNIMQSIFFNNVKIFH